MSLIRWAALTVFGLAACGGGSAAYDDILAEAKARVDAYEADVVAAPSGETCLTHRARYMDDMQPLMERMRELGGGMQTCMGGMMGGSQRGGMMGSEEGCRRMDDELEVYANVACSSADAEVNLQEGLAHCTRMRSTLQQMSPQDCGM